MPNYNIQYAANQRRYETLPFEGASPEEAVRALISFIDTETTWANEQSHLTKFDLYEFFPANCTDLTIIDVREFDPTTDTEGKAIEEWEHVDLSRPGDTFLPSDALDCGIIEAALRFFAGPKVGLDPATEYNDEVIRRANEMADTFAAMRMTWPDTGDIPDIKDLGDETLLLLRFCLYALRRSPTMHLFDYVNSADFNNTGNLARRVANHLRAIGVDPNKEPQPEPEPVVDF
jgi:hypothetical protein